MGTIAKLVAETSVDPSGVRTGLGQAARDIERFATQAQNTIKVSAQTMSRYLTMASGDFDQAMKLLEADLGRVKSRTDAITSSIERMRSVARQRQDMNLASQIVAADPFQGAGASASALPAIATPVAAAGISRTQAAMMALVFTIGNLGEQLASTDTKWQKLDRTVGTALQTIASIAVFYGPGGQLIAAIAVLGNFLSAFWTQQREEADRTAKAWEESLNRMLKSRDIGGAAGTAQGLFSGAGGIQDINRQIARQRELFAQAETLPYSVQQQARQNALNTIHELENALKRITRQHAALIGVVTQLSVAEGERAKNLLQIAKWEQQAAAPGKARQALLTQAQGLLQLEKALAANRTFSADISLRLLGTYDKLTAALANMNNQWSEQAITVRAMIAELEQSDVIRLLRTPGAIAAAIPRVGTISPIPAPELKPITAAPPALDVSTGIMTRVMAAIGPFIDVLSGVLTPVLDSLASSLGPVALIMMALQPALEALQPLLTNLLRPLSALFEVIALSLEPVLKLLFPVIRAVAVALSFFSEITMRITALFARVVGNIILFLGNAIGGLTFGLGGGSLRRLGRSIIGFSDETSRSADAVASTRKKIQRMGWDDATDSINELGDAAMSTAEALKNVPEIWKVNLARWEAMRPIVPTEPRGGPLAGYTPGPVLGNSPGPMTGMITAGITVHGNLTIQTQAKNGRQLWADLQSAARKESLRSTGRPDTWMTYAF